MIASMGMSRIRSIEPDLFATPAAFPPWKAVRDSLVIETLDMARQVSRLVVRASALTS
jgi:hypothetical protein